MGCDVHCFVEKLSPKSKWEAVRLKPTDEEEDGIPFDYDYPTFGFGNPDAIKHNARDYWTFGLITHNEVRNERWEDHQLLPSSCGKPDDMSAEVEEIIDSWGVDGHSHHYVDFPTIKEHLSKLLLNTGVSTLAKEAYEHLLSWYDELRKLATEEHGLYRVVYFFDN
ncbi:hypothetical protein VPHK482G1_0036 [Vibrio phage K482 g1]